MSKKPTTAKQIAANQRNAAKSTGPRTPRGRAASKMNAIKHGILSHEVLLSSRLGRESVEEFEALHQRFVEDLQPEGPLEEMLVDQIVTAHWRQRRALTAEAGEIARGLHVIKRRRDLGPAPSVMRLQSLVWSDPALALEQSAAGNAVLAEWLTEMRRTVKVEGALTEASIQSLAALLGGKPSSLVEELEDFRRSLDPAPGNPDAAQREDVKTETIAFLDRRIDFHRTMRRHWADQDEQENDARLAAAMLPSNEVLDKIQRYETKLERQIQRAMVQLERVQRMRRGETIPAPLSVDLSDRG